MHAVARLKVHGRSISLQALIVEIWILLLYPIPPVTGSDIVFNLTCRHATFAVDA
jgi:hypothetical protein